MKDWNLCVIERCRRLLHRGNRGTLCNSWRTVRFILKQGVFLWEQEPRIVLSVRTKRKCCIGADTKTWRIGCFFAEGVWRTLNRDLRKPTNTVALGRVRRSEISESLSALHFTEISKSDYSLIMRTLFIIPLVLMSLVSFPSWGNVDKKGLVCQCQKCFIYKLERG